MCGSSVHGQLTVSLRRLHWVVYCHPTREQLFDKAGLSGRIGQALQESLAEDAVVMAQGLEPVWRRAAQDCHIGCSFE